MRFVTYIRGQKEQLGILTKDERRVIPVSAVLSVPVEITMTEFLAQQDEHQMALLRAAWEDPGDVLTFGWKDVQECAPIVKPIHDIICVGVNYRDHMAEVEAEDSDVKVERKEHVIYFGKRANRILGDQEVVKPPFALDEKTDYETELAVIIGKEGKDIPIDEVEDYIFGYSVFNDLSSRGLQSRHIQWLKGKGLDGFTSMGPWIVTKDELPMPVEKEIWTRVNGELRQSSNTRNMICGICEIISEFSKGITLEPGDIFATGTPSGVALGMDTPNYLKSGDVVVSGIEDIGTLTLTIE